MADLLHVRMRTVADRAGVLRTLFGDVPDDPDGRFELAPATRASCVRLQSNP